MGQWMRLWTPIRSNENSCEVAVRLRRNLHQNPKKMPPMPSILVVTTVHHPGDARIRYRQIETLLRKGWRVTYAAPFRGYGLATREQVAPGLSVINLPRAVGRRRLAGLRSAHQLLKHRAGEFDLVLLHDPELLISYIGAGATNVVLDVHEDPAAAIEAKEWIPRLA